MVKNLYNPAMKEVQETISLPAAILISGYFKERHGYAVYRSHGSGNWLITYTLHGQGLYRQPGRSIWANPGDVILLQPGAIHDYSVPVEGTWEFLWAHFQPRLDWLSWWHFPEVGQGLYKTHLQNEQLQERLKRAFLNLHTDTNMPLLQQQEPINQPMRKEEPLNKLQHELALNSLEEVLLLAMRENAQERRMPIDPRIQRVIEIMSGDLAQHYDLDLLAHEVAISPSHLSHLFKQETGESVHMLLLRMRLEKATRLLEFSTHSIGLIAEEIGFNSGYYFSRMFHQRFGMSPRAYRDSIARPGEKRKREK